MSMLNTKNSHFIFRAISKIAAVAVFLLFAGPAVAATYTVNIDCSSTGGFDLNGGTSYTFTNTGSKTIAAGDTLNLTFNNCTSSFNTAYNSQPAGVYTEYCGTFSTTPPSGSGLSSSFSLTYTARIVPSGQTTTYCASGLPGGDHIQYQNSLSPQLTIYVTGMSASATAPSAPTIGTATAWNAQANVTFTAPTSNGGSAITGYTVTSSPGGLTGTGTSSPIMVTGLTNGTAYTFTVTATNSIGTSAASSASNSVTPSTAYQLGGAIQGTALGLTTSNAAVATFAGTAGSSGSTDGTGSAALFNAPRSITTDGTNLFVADTTNHTIRKVVISSGVVTTLAGSAGSSGSTNGTGSGALFNTPYGITTDGTNLFVADTSNHTIRKVVISSGVVTTLAGSAGSSGTTDGTGTAARFNLPRAITTDGTNLFVADTSNHTIRKIVISTGVVTTIAGSAGTPGSTDSTGTAAQFNFPYGITTDGTNLFVADSSNKIIRKVVISSGVVTTIAGTVGSNGSTDGTGTATKFSYPRGITTDGTNLFVADSSNNTIRKIVISSLAVTTLAGTAGSFGSTDGTGSAARFNDPYSITTDGTNLFVADSSNYTIRKVGAGFTVTTTATNGTITSTNNPTVINGSTTTVTGSASAGYYFSSVSGCNGTTQSNTNQATTTFSYTTSAITSNCTVSATFTTTATYTVTPSAGTGGSISSSSAQTINSGSTTTFTVTANTGYNVSVGGTCGGTLSGNTYTTSAITADCTVTASFSIKNFIVIPSAGANGSISPGTNFSVTYGSTTTFTVTPNTGYAASVGGTCGGTLSGNTYTTNAITDSCTVSATFTRATYTVTPSAGANGTISPSSAQTVDRSSTTTFTVTPNTGYTASVGGTCGGTLSGNTYTTNAITANCTVSATFTLNTYTVTPGAGTGGTISPSTPQTINYGSTTTFTVTPNTGYTASVGGTCGGTLSGNTYTTNAITANCTVSATFTLNTYTVTPGAGTGGTISPSTAQTINSGATTTFTVTPNTGYTASVGGTCGGTLSGNTYTTNAITTNCTVAASFTINTVTARVTASAGANGTISPSGVQTVTYGLTTTFTVTPNTGYTASVGGTCGGSLVGNTYTTNAITADCTVTASFTTAGQDVCTYTITPANQSFDVSGGTGTVSVAKSTINCVWLATSNATWITLNSGSIGDNSSTVSFTVAKNTGASRTGTLTIGGKTFTVTQAGLQHTLTLTKSGTGAGKGLIKNSDNALLCGTDCQVAVLKYDAGLAVTLSAAPETGTTFNGWSGGGCTGTGACTVTLNEDISVNAVFSAATAPATDSSTSTIGTSGNDIYINVPVIKYTDTTGSTTYYSTAFVYVPTDDNKIWVKLTKADVITDISPYSGTQMSEMYYSGSDLMLHLNNITINGAYLWADLKKVQKNDGNTWFVITGYGSNSQNTCTYGISPASQSLDSTGGTGSVSITTSSDGCVWTASSNAAWITITSGNNGSGNSTLRFKADSNTGAARTGALTIAGKTFTVTQAGIQHTLTLTKSGTGAGKGLIKNSDNALLCGTDCQVAVLQYEAGSTITLSATPESGMTFNGWSGGGCSGTGLCTVTLSEDTSVNAVFSAATAAATDSSTTTIGTSGNDVLINVPVIKYTDSSGSTTYYSTAFVYEPTDDNKIWVKLTKAAVITDISPYSGTQMSEMYYSGSDLMLHLNNITINGAYLWADLKYMPTNDGKYWFVVTGSGANKS